jgi:hypothetical protein
VWRCNLICSKHRRRVGGPGRLRRQCLGNLRTVSRKWGECAYCKFGDSMNAKTDRGAVKPLASQDASVSPIAPALEKRIREALATPGEARCTPRPASVRVVRPSMASDRVRHGPPARP